MHVCLKYRFTKALTPNFCFTSITSNALNLIQQNFWTRVNTLFMTSCFSVIKILHNCVYTSTLINRNPGHLVKTGMYYTSTVSLVHAIHICKPVFPVDESVYLVCVFLSWTRTYNEFFWFVI